MAEATVSSLPESYQKYYNDLTAQLLSTLGTGGADALQGYIDQFTGTTKKDYGVNGTVDKSTYDNYYNTSLADQQKALGITGPITQETYDKYYNQYLADQKKQLGVTGPVNQDTYDKYYNQYLSQQQKAAGLNGPVTADTYNKYYNDLSAKLLAQIGGIDYTPQSTGTIKNALQRVIRPSYDRTVQSRKEATRANRAAIDADAASRGIGASTWVTDAKQRQGSAEARDIANINSEYNSALYSALMNRLAQQDQLSQNAQAINLNAKQNALGQAMSGAGSLYSADLSKYNQALSAALSQAQAMYGSDREAYNAALSNALQIAGNMYNADLSKQNQALANALTNAGNLYNADLSKQNNALTAAYNMAQGMYSTDAQQRSQAANDALQAAWNLYQQDQAKSSGGGGGGHGSNGPYKSEQGVTSEEFAAPGVDGGTGADKLSSDTQRAPTTSATWANTYTPGQQKTSTAINYSTHSQNQKSTAGVSSNAVANYANSSSTGNNQKNDKNRNWVQTTSR